MKIKNILLGALMTVIAAPAMAQVQADAVKDQVAAIIKSGAADKDKQIASLAKQYKKDAKSLASVGKAYLAAKDFDNAKKYADMAIKANSKCADGFVLAGNIAVAKDDAGEAAMQFQQAMYADPKNPDGYRRYAQMMSKASPQDAVDALNRLRENRPDYPVDLIAAEIYSEAGKMDLAIKSYDKVNINELKDYQLSDYATNVFLSQDYEKSLKLAQAGHAKFPRNASFNRLIMFNETSLKNYDKAIAAGKDLFNNSDSVKVSSYDLGFFANALKGANKFEDAIKAYQDLQALKGIDAAQISEAHKNISDCFKKISNYDKAAEYLKKWAEAQPQKSFTMEEAAVLIYADQLADENVSAAAKKLAYEKADGLYADLAAKYPDNAAYIANKRAQMPFALGLDQKTALKMAGPHYEQFANLLAADTNRSAGQTKMLINAYNAVVAYYVHCVDDMAKAKEVSAKLIELDPENESAKAVLGMK